MSTQQTVNAFFKAKPETDERTKGKQTAATATGKKREVKEKKREEKEMKKEEEEAIYNLQFACHSGRWKTGPMHRFA